MAAKKKALSPSEFYSKLSKEDRDRIVDLKTLNANIDFVSSGSWVMDSLIGDGTLTGRPGGFPRGHIIEISGDESSGKTTLALSSIRKAQEAPGGFAVLLDFEQTFHGKYAESIGVSLDKNKLIVMTPDHFQHGARLINDALAMRPPLIVVDSVSAMTPREIIEGAVDEGMGVGLQARLMSGFLGYISKKLKDSNTCLLFINQLRSVIKKSKYDVGPDEETSGGRSIRYYSSVRIMLKKGAVEKVNTTSKITGAAGKEPVNVTIKATVIKNKIDKPWRAAPIYIRFGEGIDNILSVIELAINTKVIKKEGSKYSFTHKEGTLTCIGKEQLRRTLEEKDNIFEYLRSSLIITDDVDETTKAEYMHQEAEDAKELETNPLDAVLNDAATTYIKKAKGKKKKEEVVDEDAIETLDVDEDELPE